MTFSPLTPEAFARLWTSSQHRPLLFCKPLRFAPPKIACDRRRNPLLRGRWAFLSCREGKVDSALLLLDGGDAALFALPVCTDRETAVGLLRFARETAAHWGVQRLVGPVSADGSGFDLGICLSGDATLQPWHPPADPVLLDVLRQEGFSQETTLHALSLSLTAGKNPYAGAADWARRRFGITVSCDPVASRTACHRALQASTQERAAGQGEFMRVYTRIAQLAPRGRVFVAQKEDRPIGWVLTNPGRRTIHLLHMQLRPCARGSACAAALLDSIWQFSAASGMDRALVSTIDASNTASLQMAQNAGGQICASYGIFARNVHI